MFGIQAMCIRVSPYTLSCLSKLDINYFPTVERRGGISFIGLDAFKYLEVGYLRMITIGFGNHHLEVAGGYGFGKLHLFVGWN